MRKDTRLSTLFCTASNGKLGGAFPHCKQRKAGWGFSVLQATESWSGPGNEATVAAVHCEERHFLMLYACTCVVSFPGQNHDHLSGDEHE